MRYETNLETGETTEHPDAPIIQAVPLTQEQINLQRQQAYRVESDPIFFKEQRGEVPTGTWLAKVDEIKARYPQVL